MRQAPFAAVYRLDGSRVSVDAPAGITNVYAERYRQEILAKGGFEELPVGGNANSI